MNPTENQFLKDLDKRLWTAAAQEDDGELFEEKMKRLVTQLRAQTAQARQLDEAIAQNLKGLGYE